MPTSRRKKHLPYPLLLGATSLFLLTSMLHGAGKESKPPKKQAVQNNTTQKEGNEAQEAPFIGPIERFIGRLKDLKLSPDQQDKVEAIQKETIQKLQDLRSDKNSTPRSERRAEAEKIIATAREEALAVLNPQQRRAFFMQRQAQKNQPPGKAKNSKKEKGNSETKPLSAKKSFKIDPLAIFRSSRFQNTDTELVALLSKTPPPQPEASSQKIVFPFEQPEGNAPRTKLDQLVLKALKANDIEPSPLCSDQVFVRRVYIDMLGTLPTPEEVLTFLQDKRSNKRALLIDALFDRPEFADYWAMKWCDLLRVKAEFPINLWPNGAAAYHRWVREAIQENMPYDQFAHALLTSSGSNFRDPPSNFYRAVQQRDAKSLAEAAALTFMGTRLAEWPKGRRDEVELFFTRVGYKKTDEWKEEIVYWDPKPLDRFEATLPDGKQVKIAPETDPRQAFAEWLITPNNPWFAKNMANRVWFWLLGQGIVDQPDDFRDDNPPSNPELLGYLTKQLVDSKYDMRHLFRLILNSRTYQRSSIPRSDDPKAERLFACYPMRPLDAEVLQDAFCQIFEVEVGYSSEVPEPFTFVPKQRSTVSLADGSISSPFLQLFGRPTRDTGLVSGRETQVTKSQRMFFINSTKLNDWIIRSQLLRRLSPSFSNTQRRPMAIQLAWLSVLSRYPTPAEIDQVNQVAESSPKKYEALQDILWTLVNTKEFWSRH